MELQKAVGRVFMLLADSLSHLEDGQYHFACKNLSGNSIGQHVRHIIEMFQCLELGYQSGEVDYDKRKRDKQIETDKEYAIRILHGIIQQIRSENKALYLHTYYDEQLTASEIISTNYFREIAYNLEHTIHHMALIRVGLRELGGITVEDSYGVSSSTLKFRQQCVQ